MTAPATFRVPAGARLGAFLAVVALAATGAVARADVRSTAAWSTTLGQHEYWPLPASVCRGALPSDVEAWSARAGRRVGDRRLFVGVHPRRIVGSTYTGIVHVYVWCDADPLPWPMVKAQVALDAYAASRGGAS